MTGETRKRRTKVGNFTPKLVHEREGEDPVALLPEGATRAPVTT